MSAFLLDLLQFKAFPVVLNLMFSFRWGRNSEAIQYRRKFSCLSHPAFPGTRSALALISSSAGRQSQQDWLLRTQKWICQCKPPITCQKTFQEQMSKTVIWYDSPLERKIELTLNGHRVQGGQWYSCLTQIIPTVLHVTIKLPLQKVSCIWPYGALGLLAPPGLGAGG